MSRDFSAEFSLDSIIVRESLETRSPLQNRIGCLAAISAKPIRRSYRMRHVPINNAEAIIDPFWDPRLSEYESWTVEPGVPHGLEVAQGWCFVNFLWARSPESNPALHMHRKVSIDCEGYDRLVLSVMAPDRSVVHLEADTDTGTHRIEAPPAVATKREIVLDLGASRRIESLTIQIDSFGEGVEQGWFNWIGLQNSEHLKRTLEVQSSRDETWEQHIKPIDFEPSFKPAYGLVMNDQELSDLRKRHEDFISAGNESPFMAGGAAALAITPEEYINDYVNFWNDTRYNRERDHGKFILTHGMNAAIAGHLSKDKRLLRHAARFAMSIGMCDKWDDGFICFFPGSDFEHRCFVQSLCAYEVAGILDLAGDYFTDAGRNFLLRRLAEEGIGSINYSVWKHEYIFDCNQLAWFTPGRMLALAVLSKHFPRIKPQIETAYEELCESLGRSILSDGGYVEGPTYFRCVGRDAGLGLYYYARVTGKPLMEVIPDSMRRCGDFAEAVISTDESADVIPICDARNRHEFLSQAIMATLLPDSAWARMAVKSKERYGGWPGEAQPDASVGIPSMMADAAIAWNLVGDIKAPDALPPSVLTLPEMGPAVSVRRFGDETVKLFVQGNRAGAGHTHEDKGSFILEYAGETFAMDPGSCDYSSPFASILQNCERHNMLIPIGTPERPHARSPLPVDVKPVVSGDDTAFRAEIELSRGWEEYYRNWRRIFDSPEPGVLTIADEYELIRGTGVEFYWQTRLPVTIDGSQAIIRGSRGRVTLVAPEGTVWRCDLLPLLDGTQNRLALRCEATSGTIEVSATLSAL